MTGDVLAIVDATVDGAEGATCEDALDYELGRVDFPVVPRPLDGGDSGGDGVGVLLLLFLQGPCSVEVPLELLVESLQINLICPNKPITPFLHLSLSLSQKLKRDK